jgi:hypothetical protein
MEGVSRAPRPDLADDVEALLAAERGREDPWTFAEVPRLDGRGGRPRRSRRASAVASAMAASPRLAAP